MLSVWNRDFSHWVNWRNAPGYRRLGFGARRMQGEFHASELAGSEGSTWRQCCTRLPNGEIEREHPVPSEPNTIATAAPLVVDRIEAARLLGVCPNTIDNLRRRGELPSLRLGTRRLYDAGDLRRLIDSRKVVGR